MAHSLARARGAAAFFQSSITFKSSSIGISTVVPLFSGTTLIFERSCGPLSPSHRWHSQEVSVASPRAVGSSLGGAISGPHILSAGQTGTHGSKTLGPAQRVSLKETVVPTGFDGRPLSEEGSKSAEHPENTSNLIVAVTDPLKAPSSRALHQASNSESGIRSGPVTLVVVGGGAAGVFGAIRAKEMCPVLDVVVLEKSAPLSKVRISGGGRCNVTTGLHVEPGPLSGQYPRGHRELRGAFFRTHGPKDTADWFESRGVPLKKEDDGRMFPVTDTSATVIDCLLNEVQRLGVKLRNGANVLSVRKSSNGVFEVTLGPVTRPSVMTSDFLMLATGSAQRGYELASALGHSIIDPRPSLFTFCTPDPDLTALAGISFPHVGGQLHLDGQKKLPPGLRQEGPLLVTHWGLSGPLVLKLSAWGARDLFDTAYKGSLVVDFLPGMTAASVMEEILAHKARFGKKKLGSGAPAAFDLPRRFWLYLLQKERLDPESTWAHALSKPLQKLAETLKRRSFSVAGKGQFKDEFVKAGGVPLKEVTLATMESRVCPGLVLAGELLDVDGVTGGFNFQNAWTGGYIAGSTIARCAADLLSAGVDYDLGEEGLQTAAHKV